MKIPGQQRKAISPIVATVLIIAATLIAFAAVAGYVFGLFGTASSNPTVSQTNSALSAAGLVVAGTATSGNAYAATCVTSAPAGSTLTFTNTGTGSGAFSTMTLVLGGTSYPVTIPATGCSIAGSGTLYIEIAPNYLNPTSGLAAGQTFSGTAVLTNGDQIPLSGTLTS